MDIKKTIKRLKKLKSFCLLKAHVEVDGSPEFNWQRGRAAGIDKAMRVVKEEFGADAKSNKHEWRQGMPPKMDLLFHARQGGLWIIKSKLPGGGNSLHFSTMKSEDTVNVYLSEAARHTKWESRISFSPVDAEGLPVSWGPSPMLYGPSKYSKISPAKEVTAKFTPSLYDKVCDRLYPLGLTELEGFKLLVTRLKYGGDISCRSLEEGVNYLATVCGQGAVLSAAFQVRAHIDPRPITDTWSLEEGTPKDRSAFVALAREIMHGKPPAGIRAPKRKKCKQCANPKLKGLHSCW